MIVAQGEVKDKAQGRTKDFFECEGRQGWIYIIKMLFSQWSPKNVSEPGPFRAYIKNFTSQKKNQTNSEPFICVKVINN